MPAIHLELFLKLVQLIDIRVWYFQILVSKKQKIEQKHVGRSRSRKGLFRSVQSWEKGPKPTSAPNPHRSSTQCYVYCKPALVHIWVARVVPVFHTADWSFYPRFLLYSLATAPCPHPKSYDSQKTLGLAEG